MHTSLFEAFCGWLALTLFGVLCALPAVHHAHTDRTEQLAELQARVLELEAVMVEQDARLELCANEGESGEE